MQTLDNLVLETIEDFMKDNTLFTALDVSNKVKMTMPTVRHREVRDLVRSMFVQYIEPAGWAKTPIQVQLADGSSAEAMLYHPLSDAWDLDNRYDVQMRSQTAVHTSPTIPAPATTTTISMPPVMKPTPMPKVVSTPAPAPSMQARDLWDQMFQSKPSLFPRK